MKNDLLKKYYGKVARQGLLKALLLSLIFGFGALTISGAVCWFGGFKRFWLCIIIFAAVTLVSLPIVYFVKYRPNEKAIARKIDDCGLEERMITMTELAGNDSFIAVKQREDAMKTLSAFDASLLKFAIATPVIVLLCVFAFTGTGMATATALYQNDIIGSGGDAVTPTKEPNQYEVSYEVYGEGEIIGEFFQVVEEGKDTTEVFAEAADGYVFVGWAVDSLENYVAGEDDNPQRVDTNITKDTVIYAIFQEASDQEGEGGEGDGGEGEDGDQGEDQPQQDSDSNSSQQNQQNQNGPDSGDPTAGGKYEPNNQIIDGETYYGDEYGNSYDEGMDNLGNDNGYSEGDRGIASDYFDTIKN